MEFHEVGLFARTQQAQQLQTGATSQAGNQQISNQLQNFAQKEQNAAQQLQQIQQLAQQLQHQMQQQPLQ